MRSLLIVLLILLSIISFPSVSDWFNAQGQAVIRHDDKQAARFQATQNALKKALLVAGASVSSIQQVVNGLLTQNELNIRASGNVRSLELIDEIYQGDLVTVTIRADIIPVEKQCFAADYRKGMLLTKAHVKNREQATIGEIYAIDAQLIENLAIQLKQNSRFTDIRLALKPTTSFAQINHNAYDRQLKNLSISLANISDSQYVLYAEITDLSFDNIIRNSWQFWQEDVFDRNFAMTLYIYDGANGELIFEKKYKASAPWSFAKRAKVDVNGETFWRSEYGTMITELLTKATMDIDNSIMCLPTQGKILQVNGNEVLFNLGTRQGVKIGDEFSLLHLNNFVNSQGTTYAGFNISNYKVKVIQTTQQTAKAITLNNDLLGNIQINDIVVRY